MCPNDAVERYAKQCAPGAPIHNDKTAATALAMRAQWTHCRCQRLVVSKSGVSTQTSCTLHRELRASIFALQPPHREFSASSSRRPKLRAINCNERDDC